MVATENGRGLDERVVFVARGDFEGTARPKSVDMRSELLLYGKPIMASAGTEAGVGRSTFPERLIAGDPCRRLRVWLRSGDGPGRVEPRSSMLLRWTLLCGSDSWEAPFSIAMPRGEAVVLLVPRLINDTSLSLAFIFRPIVTGVPSRDLPCISQCSVLVSFCGFESTENPRDNIFGRVNGAEDDIASPLVKVSDLVRDQASERGLDPERDLEPWLCWANDNRDREPDRDLDRDL